MWNGSTHLLNLEKCRLVVAKVLKLFVSVIAYLLHKYIHLNIRETQRNILLYVSILYILMSYSKKIYEVLVFLYEMIQYLLNKASIRKSNEKTK